MASTGLFRALDLEWHHLANSRANRARVRAWCDDAPLRGFDSLEALITSVRQGAADPAATDRILAALARRAADDDLAARTLLQAVLPGIWNVAKRLGHGRVDDDLEAEVLAEAVDRIRTYPIDRRPRAIAANITWDVFGRITRQRRRATIPTVELVSETPLEADADPSAEVCQLVGDAVTSGRLRTRDARLLLAIAVGNDTIRERARREGVTYAAMCERWCRARSRLRLATAA